MFKVGSRVYMRFNTVQPHGSRIESGTIHRVNKNGTFGVISDFDDYASAMLFQAHELEHETRPE
jgi:hypothetical protein